MSKRPYARKRTDKEIQKDILNVLQMEGLLPEGHLMMKTRLAAPLLKSHLERMVLGGLVTRRTPQELGIRDSRVKCVYGCAGVAQQVPAR